jgi:hypothetical protein
MRSLFALCSSLVLVACGGSSADTAPIAVPAQPLIFPAQTSVAVGDYFVYARTSRTTPSRPDVSQPVVPIFPVAHDSVFVNTVAAVNADNSYVVESTLASDSLSSPTANMVSVLTQQQPLHSGVYAANHKLALIANNCEVVSALAEGLPPEGAKPGDIFSSRQSNFKSFDGRASSSCERVAKFEADESKTVPAGTFSASKYSVTQISKFSYGEEGDTKKLTETCWVSPVLGAIVSCEQSTIVTGGFLPGSTEVTDTRLIAYVRKGSQAVGPVIQRFSGKWLLTDATDSKTCSLFALKVDLTGQVSGLCQSAPWETLSAVVAPTVTGTVDAQGAIAMTLSSGATLKGQLASPKYGSGTSSDVANSKWSLSRNNAAFTAQAQYVRVH